MEYLRSYWKRSKSPLYSLIFTLPLIITYEILVFSMNKSDIVGVRNGADALFRQFFAMFDIYGFYLVGFVIMLVLFLIYYFQKTDKYTAPFQKQFFLLMLMESIIYSSLLRIIMNKILFISLSDVDLLGKGEIFAMCLGAGIYEELVFRIIFLQAIIILGKYLFKFRKTVAIVMGIVFSSLLFAIFHYIGDFSDKLDILSFLFRFLAGVILAIIFIFRGYGIAAYTHTIYDLLIFF